MTINDIEDIGEVLRGYDHWRKARLHAIENGSDDQLSVSVYIDELAKARALEVLTQIQALYTDSSIPWQEVDAEIRNLIGVG